MYNVSSHPVSVGSSAVHSHHWILATKGEIGVTEKKIIRDDKKSKGAEEVTERRKVMKRCMGGETKREQGMGRWGYIQREEGEEDRCKVILNLQMLI